MSEEGVDEIGQVRSATLDLVEQVRRLSEALTVVSELQTVQAETSHRVDRVAVEATSANKRIARMETVVPLRRERFKRLVFALLTVIAIGVLAAVEVQQHAASVKEQADHRRTQQRAYEACLTRNQQQEVNGEKGLQAVVVLIQRLEQAEQGRGQVSPQALAAYQAFLDDIAAPTNQAPQLDCHVYLEP